MLSLLVLLILATKAATLHLSPWLSGPIVGCTSWRHSPPGACVRGDDWNASASVDDDLDRAWLRWQREGLIEESVDEYQARASALLWEKELAVLSARSAQTAARDDLVRAKAELEEVVAARERLRRLNPFSTIRKLSGWTGEAVRIGISLCAVALLLHALADSGPEGAVG